MIEAGIPKFYTLLIIRIVIYCLTFDFEAKVPSNEQVLHSNCHSSLVYGFREQ